MTREEAIVNVRKIKNYMCAGNPILDTRTIEQTLDMAIEALEQPEISDDIKNSYFDGYDNGYNEGFEAGQHDVMLGKAL